jgi:hypothetical protein
MANFEIREPFRIALGADLFDAVEAHERLALVASTTTIHLFGDDPFGPITFVREPSTIEDDEGTLEIDPIPGTFSEVRVKRLVDLTAEEAEHIYGVGTTPLEAAREYINENSGSTLDDIVVIGYIRLD